MENLEKNSDKKLYTIGWIGFATYLGGPLAGSYLMSKNFENLGNKDYAQNTLKIGVIVTLLLFGLLPFVPESIMNKVPNSMIPLVYTSVLYSFMTKYQNKEIEVHLKNNGAKQSGWKATGVAILSLVISLAYFFAIVMFLPPSMLG